MPHHRPTDAVLTRGDFVKIDFGAVVAGYHSDMTRTFVLGAVADWQRDLYGLVAQAQRVVGRLERIAATVDDRLPAMLAELQQTLEVTRGALPGITNQVGQVLETARLTLPGLTNNLDAVLANTRDLTAQLRDTWPMLTNTLDLTLLASRQLVTNINGVIPTLASNVNVTFTNVNVLLSRDTNITANTSLLVSNINQVLTRHWLFRSAFPKPGATPSTVHAPPRPPVRSRSPRDSSNP